MTERAVHAVRRATALLLPASMMIAVASVAAVSVDAAEGPAGADGRCGTTDSPPVDDEIVLWHPLSANPLESLTDQVALFNGSHPDITLSAVQFDNYDVLLDELAVAPTDELPDIVLGSTGSLLNFASSSLTIRPGECSDVGPLIDDLLPIAAASFSVGDELVAVPYNMSTPVLMFNGALVERAGLDPASPPRTLDELRAASDRVQEAGAAEHGLVVYDQYAAWLVRQFAAQRGHLLATPDNGRSGEPVEDLLIDTDEIVADFEWLRDGVLAGSFLWIGGNPSGNDDLVRLTSDVAEAAYSIHTSASIGDLIDVLEQGLFPGSVLSVAPLPGGGGLVGGGGLWLLDRADPDRARAAWTAIEFLIAPEQLADLAMRTGYVPPRRSAIEVPSLVDAWTHHPELRVGYDQLAAMDGSASAAGLLVVPSSEFDRYMNDALGAIIHDGLDIHDSLAGFEAMLTELMLDSEPHVE